MCRPTECPPRRTSQVRLSSLLSPGTAFSSVEDSLDLNTINTVTNYYYFFKISVHLRLTVKRRFFKTVICKTKVGREVGGALENLGALMGTHRLAFRQEVIEV